MDAFFLPGNSSKNKEWIDSVTASCSNDFKVVTAIHYTHWETGEEMIDIKKEAEKVAKIVGKSKDYIVFAKSAGVLVALSANLRPKKFIFAGTPINWAKENKIPFDSLFKSVSAPALFIQKTSDPAIGYSELKQLMEEFKIKNAKFKEIEGNDHHYSDVESLRKDIIAFSKN